MGGAFQAGASERACGENELADLGPAGNEPGSQEGGPRREGLWPREGIGVYSQYDEKLVGYVQELSGSAVWADKQATEAPQGGAMGSRCFPEPLGILRQEDGRGADWRGCRGRGFRH